MAKINPMKIANDISVLIGMGGAVVGVNNPNIGAGMTVVGGLIPIVVNKVNKYRQDAFISSVNANLNTSISQDDYAEKPEVYDQILDTVRKAMMSESDYTIFMMGKITADVINESRRYTQNELQIIDALCRMNDYDFVNFMILCNQIEELGRKSANSVLVNETDLHGEGDSSKDNVLFTLKKLNGLNLFDYSPAAIDDNDMQMYCSSNFYSMNSLTKDLMKLIESVEKPVGA